MAITVFDPSDVPGTLQSTYLDPFELTSYADGTTTLKLASGRTEEIGGALYLVDTADFTITTAGPTDGVVYVYVGEDGITPGNGAAYLSKTAPTFDPNKGGYYSGSDKAIFRMTKSGTTYTLKRRLSKNDGNFVFDNVSIDQVDGSLTVADDLTVGDDLIVGGQITNARSMWHGEIWGGTTSENTVFDALSPYIPTTGDKMLITGSLVSGVGGALRNHTFSQAERLNATSIYLWGTFFNSDSLSYNAVKLLVQDGDSSTLADFISISW